MGFMCFTLADGYRILAFGYDAVIFEPYEKEHGRVAAITSRWVAAGELKALHSTSRGVDVWEVVDHE